MDGKMSRRDEFQMYLSETGLRDFLVNVFEKLLRLHEFPRDPLKFLHDQMGCTLPEPHQTEILKVLSDGNIDIHGKMEQLHIYLQQYDGGHKANSKLRAKNGDDITVTDASVQTIDNYQQNGIAAVQFSSDTNVAMEVTAPLEQHDAGTSATPMEVSTAVGELSMPVEKLAQAAAVEPDCDEISLEGIEQYHRTELLSIPQVENPENQIDELSAPAVVSEIAKQPSNEEPVNKCGVAVSDLETSADKPEPLTAIETQRTMYGLKNSGDSLSTDEIFFYIENDTSMLDVTEVTVIGQLSESIDEDQTSLIADKTFEIIDEPMDKQELCILNEIDESFSEKITEISVVLSTIHEEDEDLEREYAAEEAFLEGALLNEHDKTEVAAIEPDIMEAARNKIENTSNVDNFNNDQPEATSAIENDNCLTTDVIDSFSVPDLKASPLEMSRRLDRSDTKYTLDNFAAKMKRLKCNDEQSDQIWAQKVTADTPKTQEEADDFTAIENELNQPDEIVADNEPNMAQSKEIVLPDAMADMKLITDQPIADVLIINEPNVVQSKEMVVPEIMADTKLDHDQPIADILVINEPNVVQAKENVIPEVIGNTKLIRDQTIADVLTQNGVPPTEIADMETISKQINSDSWTQNEATVGQIKEILVSEIICDQSDSDYCKTSENEPEDDRSERMFAKEPAVGTDIISDQPIADEYTDKAEPVDVEEVVVADMKMIPDQSITDELAAIESEPWYSQTKKMVVLQQSISEKDSIDTTMYTSIDEIKFTGPDTPLNKNPFMGTPVPAKRTFITSLNLVSSASAPEKEASPNRELFDPEMEFLMNHQTTADKDESVDMNLPRPKRLKWDTDPMGLMDDDDWLNN